MNNTYYDPFSIGFDSILHKLNTQTKQVSFPPYNIIKVNETEFHIELAIAGYSKEELSVAVEELTLKVSGNKEDKPSSNTYLYKGISSKSFNRSFVIADTVEVSHAEYTDGILKIVLINNIPEQKKPKSITIK